MINNWAAGKIIFSDFDGTFTGSGGKWSEKNISAIMGFIAGGGFFTFATGRCGMDELLPDYCKIVNAPMICCQGALIRSLSGQPIYENFFDYDTAKSIEKDLSEEFSGRIQRVDTHKNKTGDKYYKIVAVAEPEVISEIADSFYEKYGDNIQYCYPCSHLIEFLDVNSTKGNAAQIVADNVGAKEIYAIGDYLNDISMIKVAHHGACPANAIDKVKQICKGNILCDSTDGAVAELIYRIREDKLK